MLSFSLLQESDKDKIIPFLKILNQNILEEILTERLIEMFAQGYKCVGIFDGEKMIGVSGLWITTKYYIGKHIEPDNVIIHPEYQGKGVGKYLMQWVYEYAKSQGCTASELNCYVTNHAGQRFWANEGNKIIGFHYQKML